MLTLEQIESFHRSGFLIIKGLLGGAELERLREAANRVAEEGMACKGTDHLYHVFPDGTSAYRRSERMWSRDPAFQAVTVHPALLAAIGQCIGQPFFPWNDSLVVKAPGRSAPVPWHQDPPYGEPERKRTYPVPNFTTDIYLDRSTTANGCVHLLPGRHLEGYIDLAARTDEEWFSCPGCVPAEMEPGDVLFHALSVPHGSRATTDTSMRRTFYVHYLAQEVYEDGYARLPWAREKPGWCPKVRDRTRAMLATRENLGLGGPSELDAQQITLTDEGFLFKGNPVSPLRAWADPRCKKEALL